MPFQTTPEIDFASIGLVTDMPAHSLTPGAWSRSLNVRIKDGSVQGVNSFVDSFLHNVIGCMPYAVTQWTPAGSDDLLIAFIANHSGGKGMVFVYNTTTLEILEITNQSYVGGYDDASFTIDNKYPPQIYVFNEHLIVNPGTGNPQHMSSSAISSKFITPLSGSIDPDSVGTPGHTHSDQMVHGTDTKFLSEVSVGDVLFIHDTRREVIEIVDDLTLYVDVPYNFSDLSGSATIDSADPTKLTGQGNTVFASGPEDYVSWDLVGKQIIAFGIERTVTSVTDNDELIVNTTFEFDEISTFNIDLTPDSDDPTLVTSTAATGGFTHVLNLRAGSSIGIGDERREVIEVIDDTNLHVKDGFHSNKILGVLDVPVDVTVTRLEGDTTFTSQLSSGDKVKVSGVERVVYTVVSDDEFTVTESFEKDTLVGTVDIERSVVSGTLTNFSGDIEVGQEIIVTGLAGEEMTRTVTHVVNDLELYVNTSFEYETLTGIIDPTDGASIIGAGTLFNEELAVGDVLSVQGQERVITEITNNESLTVADPFGYVAISGVSILDGDHFKVQPTLNTATNTLIDVVGTDTLFQNDFIPGDKIVINEEEREIDAVTSNILLKVTEPFLGTATDYQPWKNVGANLRPDSAAKRMNISEVIDSNNAQVGTQYLEPSMPIAVVNTLGTDANATIIEVEITPSNTVKHFHNITGVETSLFYRETTTIQLGSEDDPYKSGYGGTLDNFPNWIVFPKNQATQADVDLNHYQDGATIPEGFEIGDLKDYAPIEDYLGNPVTYVGQILKDGAVRAIARIIKPYKNRLIAMRLYNDVDTILNDDDAEFPIDFVWSTNITQLDSLDSVEWTASALNDSGDAFLTQTPGKILDGGELGDAFMVYKEDAVIKVSETGDPVYPFRFESVAEDDGLYSPRCFANIGNQQHLVIGNYGVYIIDSNGQKTHIAKGIFQDTLYQLVNPLFKDRSFVFHQTRDKEVWFCFSSNDVYDGSGNSDANNAFVNPEACNKAFVWNYENQKLHYRDLPDVSSMHEAEFEGALKIYATIPSTLAIQELSSTELVPGGWFERSNESLEDTTTIKNISRVHVKASGALKAAITGTFSISEYKPYVFDNIDFNPATMYKIDTRISGRYLNLKVQMTTDDNDIPINPKLTTMRFDMRLMGNR